MADLDIIIPAFNPPPGRLERAVESALACPGSRVIVVDDGSEVPATVSGSDGSRVLLLRQANAGPSAARNAGLAASDAPLVLFLDEDDVLIPEGVAALIEDLALASAVGAVAARYEIRPGASQRLRPVPLEWAGRTLPGPWAAFRPITLFNASGLLIARRAVDAGLRFDERLKIGEDRDFIARLVKMGAVAVSPAPAVMATMHEGGTNLTSPVHMARRVRDHALLLDRHLNDASRENLRKATRWLVNAASKSGVPEADWELLSAACRRLGLRIPLKARLRRWRGLGVR